MPKRPNELLRASFSLHEGGRFLGSHPIQYVVELAYEPGPEEVEFALHLFRLLTLLTVRIRQVYFEDLLADDRALSRLAEIICAEFFARHE